jgi:hypothetical protein
VTTVARYASSVGGILGDEGRPDSAGIARPRHSAESGRRGGASWSESFGAMLFARVWLSTAPSSVRGAAAHPAATQKASQRSPRRELPVRSHDTKVYAADGPERKIVSGRLTAQQYDFEVGQEVV